MQFSAITTGKKDDKKYETANSENIYNLNGKMATKLVYKNALNKLVFSFGFEIVSITFLLFSIFKIIRASIYHFLRPFSFLLKPRHHLKYFVRQI